MVFVALKSRCTQNVLYNSPGGLKFTPILQHDRTQCQVCILQYVSFELRSARQSESYPNRGSRALLNSRPIAANVTLRKDETSFWP